MLLINISTECLKWRLLLWQMWESMFHQMMHVRIASDRQTIQSFDWSKWRPNVLWCYLVSRLLSWPNIILDGQTRRLSIRQLSLFNLIKKKKHSRNKCFPANISDLTVCRFPVLWGTAGFCEVPDDRYDPEWSTPPTASLSLGVGPTTITLELWFMLLS